MSELQESAIAQTEDFLNQEPPPAKESDLVDFIDDAIARIEFLKGVAEAMSLNFPSLENAAGQLEEWMSFADPGKVTESAGKFSLTIHNPEMEENPDYDDIPFGPDSFASKAESARETWSS